MRSRRSATYRAHLNRLTVDEDFTIGGRAETDAQSLGVLSNLLQRDVCAFGRDEVEVELRLYLQRLLFHEELCEFLLEDTPVESGLLGIRVEHLEP